VNCRDVSYEKSNAYVYQVDKHHIVRRYFDLLVYYRYNYKGKVYENSFKHRLGRSTDIPKLAVGDSILIRFKENRPNRPVFLKITYDEDFFKGLKKLN
jgi:hypothetical protein